MNLILQLAPDTEAKLKERASLAGKRVEDVALEVLEERLSDDAALAPTLSTEAWLQEFDAWVSSHNSRNPQVDDSRESIYPDRW